MKTMDEGHSPAARLRWRAEERLRREAASEIKQYDDPKQSTIHELQVHQLELMMQNEELLKVQRELIEARARYFDLYDLAPVGYCIVSAEGLILEANLTAVTLLGTAKAALVKQPITRFIFPEDQDIYYLYRKRFLEKMLAGVCELRMLRKDGSTFWVCLTAAVAPRQEIPSAQEGEGIVRLVISDITDRKRIEEEKAQLEAQLLGTQSHRNAPLSGGRGKANGTAHRK